MLKGSFHHLQREMDLTVSNQIQTLRHTDQQPHCTVNKANDQVQVTFFFSSKVKTSQELQEGYLVIGHYVVSQTFFT